MDTLGKKTAIDCPCILYELIMLLNIDILLNTKYFKMKCYDYIIVTYFIYWVSNALSYDKVDIDMLSIYEQNNLFYMISILMIILNNIFCMSDTRLSFGKKLSQVLQTSCISLWSNWLSTLQNYFVQLFISPFSSLVGFKFHFYEKKSKYK